MASVSFGHTTAALDTSHPGFLCRLPPELVEIIGDFLADDAGALIACGLTCSQLYFMSRTHLFRDVILESASKLNRFTARSCPRHNFYRFEELLDKSPHIGQHVRDLRAYPSTNADVRILSSIAPLLGKVEEFHLHPEFPSFPAAVEFASIGPVKRLNINIPSRWFLSEHNITILSTYLATFRTINDLTLGSDSPLPHISNGRAAPLTEALSRMYLRCLVFEAGVAPLLIHWITAYPPTGIESLIIREYNGPLSDNVLCILNRVAGGLAHLHLTLSPEFKADHILNGALYNAIDLLHRLTSLSIKATRAESRFISRIVTRLPSRQLERLNLTLGYQGPQKLDLVLLASCKTLARNLQDMHRFPRLSDVFIYIQGTEDSEQSWQTMVSLIRGYFSELQARGILQLECVFYGHAY